MKKFVLLILFAAFSFFANLDSQIPTPAASPFSKLTQVVGLTEITIEYSRPGVKGRTIFAKDGLVPLGNLWRTGANSATKISFSDEVTISGNKLAAGAYAILTVPGATMWKINFYPYESGNFNSYVEMEPTLSVTGNVTTLPDPIMVETFSIGVGTITNTGADLNFLWENSYVSVPIGVDVDSKVMAAIDRTLGGPSSNDYYAAGSYYYAAGKDLEKALKYVRKATQSENPMFWQVRTEALILADLGNYKAAIKVANKSIELAKAAENEDYVRNNQKSIAEWTAKVQ